MTHPLYPNVPADADYFIAKNLGPSYTLWKRLHPAPPTGEPIYQWDAVASFLKEGRTLILHGIGAKDRSCFDADRNRFITGSIEQLDRFE